MFQKVLKRSSKDTVQYKNSEYIHKDILIKLISDVIDGKSTGISTDDIECSEVVNKWNEMTNMICITKREILIDVNKVLQEVTGMDSIRDMVKSVNTQTDALHLMSSNSEELTASIEDVSNMAQKVSENSNDTKQVTGKGVETISNSIKFVKESFDNIVSIDGQMKSVKSKTLTINEIINIVKEIADQTNLLSLNASIEAARAGEHGKGFAVVANEVKKLAEHTKNSVVNIQDNITSLQKDIDLSVEKVSEASQQLDEGKQLVDEALESINLIHNSIDSVNDTIMQVAANTEEQTAAVESFTSNVTELSKQADYIDNNCHNIGKYIYDLSKKIDLIRLEMIKNRFCVTDSDMIEIYKTDHLLWRWRVYNMLLGNEKVNIDEVKDYKKCRLGLWYYGVECDKFRDNKVFIELEKPHIELHKLATEATIAYEKNDIRTAEECLKKMDECSVKVFALMDELEKLL